MCARLSISNEPFVNTRRFTTTPFEWKSSVGLVFWPTLQKATQTTQKNSSLYANLHAKRKKETAVKFGPRQKNNCDKTLYWIPKRS